MVDRYTVAFHLKRPSAAFPISLVMGIVPEGTGSAASRQPVGSGPYRLAEFVPDDHVTLVPFAEAFQGAPKNTGLTFKVVPDETMRGLELRKGSVDLVVNDLSPDMVHSLEQEGRLTVTRAPGTDYAYLGFNLRDPLLAGPAHPAGDRLRHRSRRDHQPSAPRTGPRCPWHRARRCRGPTQATRSGSPTILRAPKRCSTRRDCRDPDGDGPEPRLRLTLKTSTAETYRVQAAVLQAQLAEVGIALDLRSYEFATLMSDVVRGNVQLYTLQYVGVTDPDMLRRAFHSAQVPPDGFNRGHYANPEVDRLIEAATSALDEGERRQLYGDAQRIVATDAPYISLWAKTNVAVAQPNLSGIRLSPIADFAFLKDVSRGEPRTAPR